jgi:hypothetical protein
MHNAQFDHSKCNNKINIYAEKQVGNYSSNADRYKKITILN